MRSGTQTFTQNDYNSDFFVITITTFNVAISIIAHFSNAKT